MTKLVFPPDLKVICSCHDSMQKVVAGKKMNRTCPDCGSYFKIVRG